jgi:(5-formylfuran-3-yl)methyl phosphate synthase
MPRLLISVRNVLEAKNAIEGGADLIDIKEPTRGSLGQADQSIIAEIAAFVAARRPLSAALGELNEPACEPRPADFSFVKWGLRGCANVQNWPGLVAERIAKTRRSNPRCQAVGVAYADWGRAEAPDPADTIQLAFGAGCLVILVDTCLKDGSNLLDWLELTQLREMRDRTRAMGLQLALAGGIDFDLLPTVLEIEPDWIAIRGAACAEGREGTLCAERVANLARVVHGYVGSSD